MLCISHTSSVVLLYFFLTNISDNFIRILYNYIYNEGPQPRSQKCLVLRPQKQACWKFPSALIIICYQHSYHECKHTHTHTQREGPWMQGMVSCKKKPPFLDLLRSMSAQHGETYKATFNSQCLDHDCACGTGIQTNILGITLTWKPAMRFGAWI